MIIEIPASQTILDDDLIATKLQTALKTAYPGCMIVWGDVEEGMSGMGFKVMSRKKQTERKESPGERKNNIS